MRSSVCLGLLALAPLSLALPRDRWPFQPVIHCEGPTVTWTVVIEETQTSFTTAAATEGNALAAVTSIVIVTATGTPSSSAFTCPTGPTKRDLPTQDEAQPSPDLENNDNIAPNPPLPAHYFRNPHHLIYAGPHPLPPCPTSLTSTSTTSPISTRTTTITSTLTTTLAAQDPPTLTVTTTLPTTPSNCPTVPATATQSNYTTDYVRYFTGCGLTLSYSNPGNTNPPITLPLSGELPVCEAVAQCATAARNQGAGYLSIDLHFRLEGGGEWECVMFYGRNREAEFFDVRDEGVGVAVGYSI